MRRFLQEAGATKKPPDPLPVKRPSFTTKTRGRGFVRFFCNGWQGLGGFSSGLVVLFGTFQGFFCFWVFSVKLGVMELYRLLSEKAGLILPFLFLPSKKAGFM
jgi:hypothetical protein|mmetsp:Transcript_37333/g.62162  ORF Transcript_37333/g.62162 Transcript_37333/m.62162 type:complete len:103 (-) Transcript_37333:429-737(-)